MRILIAIYILLMSNAVLGQNISVDVGLDQHVAGGGPYVGLAGQYKGYRFGIQALTHINGFSPYKFQRYGYFRYAQNVAQVFGGGFSLGYEFKKYTTQRVRPILIYRGAYFYTAYARDSKSSGSYIRLYAPPSFSTIQSFAAGVTVDLYKGLRLDLTAGGGLYIFRDSQVFVPSGENYPIDVRPDLTFNLGVSYMFEVGKKK